MATSLQAKGPEGIPIDLRATPDGQLIVNVGGVDRELLITRYTCKTAWTGAVVGQVIRQTQTLDVSGEATTVISVMWENESTGLPLLAPPGIAANLEPITQGSSLTQAQLQLSGLATASNQITQIGYLADLADNPHDRHAAHKLVQSEDLGLGEKFILKSDGVRWLMVKKTYADTGSALTYAGPGNNPTITLAQVWGLRTSLLYGSIKDA